ncbi:fad binding domain containing [Fusarium albosuccineum]|uniref:Fad binding domain containing n=1 Tax=Fusarium albosuccineum TaxID=1237068 RepID=A0A8H4LMQ0_9HYPO|nr:fad binding domain containing [Fusarium albosuccineum]
MKKSTLGAIVTVSTAVLDAALAGVGGQNIMRARTSADCCRVLKEATAIAEIYLPGDTSYQQQVESYWSITAQLQPDCFVLPQNTEEVSSAVKTIVEQTDCKFAVRSGGHSSTAGANNIEDGVTIDLSLLSGIEYYPETGLASGLPGTTWLDVYRTLDPLGRGVPGGRLGHVGVGGFLLGGGFSYYLYRDGVACNSIHGMEVVLANGTIVKATADRHADLFVALKGGGNNFGIVIRFDMETFETRPIWTWSKQYPESAGESFEMNSAFDELGSIPGNISSTMGHTNMSTIALNEQAAGYRNIWWSLTLRNDERIISKAVTAHQSLVDEMKAESSDGDFETQCFFQPFPAFLGQMGPNSLGIERHDSNAVVLLASLAVNGADQETLGREKMFRWKRQVEEYARRLDGLLEYTYMNYADGSQDVVRSYGQENVCKMWAVSKKYDPKGVMQTRQPGGFKLPMNVSC